MLAQKIALETFECRALAVANRCLIIDSAPPSNAGRAGRAARPLIRINRQPLAEFCSSRLERLFIDANYLPVSLVAKLDFAGPPIEALNADR
jgi:hypothetical protein